MERGWTVCLSILACLLAVAITTDVQHNHDRVKMGVINHGCDDANFHALWDWDNRTTKDYLCQRDEDNLVVYESKPTRFCLPRDRNFPPPMHKCMNVNITYPDKPPVAGSHRPLWPMYGTYSYCPPQRWVHSLEHGAAVFLYHPCGDYKEIKKLKKTARSCLYRHVITPYKGLPAAKPYAVVTYGCRLMMSEVDVKAVKEFLMDKAISGPEMTSKNGQYMHGLIKHAQIVEGSDKDDTKICPSEEDEQPEKSNRREEKQKYNGVNLDDGIY